MYVYPLLASFEAAKFAKPNNQSIAEQLHGFGKMPTPEKGKEYDFTVSAVQAFSETAKKVVFSSKVIGKYQEKLLADL